MGRTNNAVKSSIILGQAVELKVIANVITSRYISENSESLSAGAQRAGHAMQVYSVIYLVGFTRGFVCELGRPIGLFPKLIVRRVR